MATSTTAVVPLDNDYEYEYDVTRKATTTGEREAAKGLSSVTAHFSATDGGADIGSTETTLTERSAKDGRYYGILDKAQLNTDLTAYLGQTIYEVFVVDGDAETSTPVIVTPTGRAT